jgi:hypothetical protein
MTMLTSVMTLANSLRVERAVIFHVDDTAPGDVDAITPQHAPWRTNEYPHFSSGAVAEWCAALGIAPIGYREIQELWCSIHR